MAGFKLTSTSHLSRYVRNFGGSNTGGTFDTATIAADVQNGSGTLTDDPFNAASSGDFSTNTTAGGGAVVRSQVVTFPRGGGTTSYEDAGAAQHADPASSSVVVIMEG